MLIHPLHLFCNQARVASFVLIYPFIDENIQLNQKVCYFSVAEWLRESYSSVRAGGLTELSGLAV